MIGKNTTQTLKFKLNSLLEITRAINDNLPVDILLGKYTDVLCDKLNIGKVVMFKSSGEWECILSAGVDHDVVSKIHMENLLPLSEITFVNSSDEELTQNFQGFDIIIPVFNNNVPIAYVLIGDIEEEMEGVSPVIKHLHFIQTISNIIVVAIENIRLFKESLRQEALKKELELASQMQNLLVPKISDLPRNKHIVMTGFYKPHYEVGGDYFDCIELGDHKTGFCVADVSGKGIAASLLMSNFQATLRAIFTSDIPMEALVDKLNASVYKSAQGEKFITLFLARYDDQTYELEYANCGHTSSILFGTESKTISLLESKCLGMGMLDELPFVNAQKIKITEHSLLLSYTDGLVEVLSDSEEGVDSVFDLVQESLQQSANIDEALGDIIEGQRLEKQNEAIFDDITLLGVEFFVQ